MAIVIFRDLQAEEVSILHVVFVASLIVDHASGTDHASSADSKDILGGIAPIDVRPRLGLQDQVLSFSRLVGMEDRMHRRGRLWVVPPALDSSPHQQLEAEDRGDDHLLEARCTL